MNEPWVRKDRTRTEPLERIYFEFYSLLTKFYRLLTRSVDALDDYPLFYAFWSIIERTALWPACPCGAYVGPAILRDNKFTL